MTDEIPPDSTDEAHDAANHEGCHREAIVELPLRGRALLTFEGNA